MPILPCEPAFVGTLPPSLTPFVHSGPTEADLVRAVTALPLDLARTHRQGLVEAALASSSIPVVEATTEWLEGLHRHHKDQWQPGTVNLDLLTLARPRWAGPVHLAPATLWMVAICPPFYTHEWAWIALKECLESYDPAEGHGMLDCMLLDPVLQTQTADDDGFPCVRMLFDPTTLMDPRKILVHKGMFWRRFSAASMLMAYAEHPSFWALARLYALHDTTTFLQAVTTIGVRGELAPLSAHRALALLHALPSQEDVRGLLCGDVTGSAASKAMRAAALSACGDLLRRR